jgi:hypothetical protein
MNGKNELDRQFVVKIIIQTEKQQHHKAKIKILIIRF